MQSVPMDQLCTLANLEKRRIKMPSYGLTFSVEFFDVLRNVLARPMDVTWPSVPEDIAMMVEPITFLKLLAVA